MPRTASRVELVVGTPPRSRLLDECEPGHLVRRKGLLLGLWGLGDASAVLGAEEAAGVLETKRTGIPLVFGFFVGDDGERRDGNGLPG